MAREAGPELLAAKRDLSFLKSVLNLNSDKTADWNSPCPVCQDRTAMQWGADKTHHGEWYWHCNKCKAGGDIVEALTKAAGLSYADAFKKIREQFSRAKPDAKTHTNGNGNTQPDIHYGVEKPEPVLDHDLAEACIGKYHRYLLDHLSLVKKWGRGLSEEVIVKYRVGFCEHGDIQGVQGKKMSVPGAWVLPITDKVKLKGVKLHFEERPHWNSGECPKLLWAPFGTTPPYAKNKLDDGTVVETKPVHSYYGLWPHPDTLQHRHKVDFSMEPQWYIERIPKLSGDLKNKFELQYEANQLFLASDRQVNTDGLSEGDLWDCRVRAFEEFKGKIMDAVIKLEDTTKSKTDWSSYTFVCPGELKALAALSIGLTATSPTGGESWMPTEPIFAKLARDKLCLFYDGDQPKRIFKDKNDPSQGVLRITNAGIEWAWKWAAALARQGATHVILKQGGQREKA